MVSEMNTTPSEWKEIAFSYQQIEEFLYIIALPYHEADALFNGRSPQLRCFGTGFYFFIHGIKNELAPHIAEELHTLACRVEQACSSATVGNWQHNADEAEQILRKYFVARSTGDGD